MKSSDHTSQTLRGTLHKIIYYNDEKGYLIGLLKAEGKSISIVGTMPSPREGEEYSLDGKWVVHAKYGKQFKFESYEVKPPTTIHGIEEYLASGLIRGVGPALAARIVKKFGTQTIAILNSHPERLREVDGIGPKKLECIVAAAATMREMQEVLLFLKTYDIGTSTALKIFRAYGKRTVPVVKENPYQMIQDIEGIGFKIADSIARKIGVEPESEARISAGIMYVLDDACRAAGHCYLPAEELQQRTAELLGIDEAKVGRILDALIHHQIVMSDDDRIFPLLLYRAEVEVATKVETMTRKPMHPFALQKLTSSLKHIERRNGIEYEERQRNAILSAVQHHVTILTGGPGTGKTLCVNGIIELADELGLSYLLCAPTGRAAKRLSELTKREAKTIHRMLEYDPRTNSFRRDGETPLDCSLVIVDEVSMVDIQLFAALLGAVKTESQLVLVGDVDQLPSVGPGQVLRDLIDSNRITTVRLNTIFRQSEESAIISNSAKINEGSIPVFANDFQFIQEGDLAKLQGTILRLCSTILPQNIGVDPFLDIQVLSPMHNSLAGVRELNTQLQRVLNGHSKVCWQGSERKFLLHDKVMQVKNNYDKEVYNGDIGYVCGVDREEGKLLVDFDNRTLEYDFEELDELVLAYAMTIHKSQGNEFKVVIVPMVMAHYIMLQRNLLYTAVTRARERIILIGEMKAVSMAIRNNVVRQRNTRLRQRLADLI